MLSLIKGDFLICMFLKSYMLHWNWQQGNLFVKSSAEISVLYKTFPGIYSANCCNIRGIVVKKKRDV